MRRYAALHDHHRPMNPRTHLIKEQVRAAIDDSWRSFRQALEPLTSADMEVPGVCGDWSVKEVLIHVSAWETRSTASLLAGKPGPALEDPDGFDEVERERHKDMDVAEASTQLDATHRALRDAIDASAPELFSSGSSLRKELDDGTSLHYDEHADGIRIWYALYRRARASGGG
ncbi:MAG: hypothetical protein HOL45_08375 [Chloroflexi bacterium]|nr:hypothetical protein [Chloroflexota bacterium]